MSPLAHSNEGLYNQDMEGRFRAGLSYIPPSDDFLSLPMLICLTSLSGGPGFHPHPSRQGSNPMEDTFEINQTGLSPMWYACLTL